MRGETGAVGAGSDGKWAARSGGADFFGHEIGRLRGCFRPAVARR